jgi:hypothetical protein
MIHPRKRGNPQRPRRAVVHFRGTDSAVWTPVDHRAHLSPLDALRHAVHRRCTQVWITPTTDEDWGAVIPELLTLGCKVSPRLTSEGRIGGLRAHREGFAVNGQDARHVATHPATDPLTAARETWRQLDGLDAYLRESFGVSLCTGLPGTAVAILATFLKAPVGVSPHVASLLRDLDAYGGGRVEALHLGTYVRGEPVDPITGEVLDPHEFDLPSAYPSALLSGDIPTELVESRHWKTARAMPWDQRGSLSTAVVRVEGDYPAIRYRKGGRVFYPRGELVVTVTPEELTAPGVTPLRVLHWYRFDIRDEFARFAEALIRARNEVGRDTFLGKAMKLLANAAIGKFGQRPRTEMLSTELVPGARYVSPGIYALECFVPSKHELLPVAITVNGRVRAHVARGLDAMHNGGCVPALIDTDGGIVLGDPRAALHGLGFVIKSLRSAEVFSGKQSITVDLDGNERVRAGGFAGGVAASVLRGYEGPPQPFAGALPLTRYARGAARLESWIVSNRHQLPHGRTAPYHVKEIPGDRGHSIQGEST